LASTRKGKTGPSRLYDEKSFNLAARPEARESMSFPGLTRSVLITAAIVVAFLLIVVMINQFYYHYRARLLVKKGLRLYDQKKKNEAFLAYKQSLYFDPSSSMALSLIGEIFLQKGDIARASLYLDRAIACKKIDGKGFFYRGCLFCCSGESGELKKLLTEKAVMLSKGDEPYADLLKLTAAVMFPSQREYLVPQDRIVKDRLLAIRATRFFKIHLGFIALYRGEADEAIALFTSVVAQEPQNPYFQTYLAIALLKKGKTAGALSILQKVAYGENINYLALQYLGKSYSDENLLDDAEKTLLRAIALNGNSAGGYYFLGEVSYKKKDYASARRYYFRSLNIQINNGEALKKLGDILKNMKLEAQADLYLNKALVNEGPLYILAPNY
jgi:tetratricopeptide (TPR) repeat protein